MASNCQASSPLSKRAGAATLHMLPQLDSPLSVSEPIWIEIFDKWSTAGKTFMADQESSQRAVHWLPCTVESNGPAGVRSYFSSTVKRMDTQLDGQEVLEAHFRGRQLKGVECVWQSSKVCST